MGKESQRSGEKIFRKGVMALTVLKCFWCKDDKGEEVPLEQYGGGNIAIHFVCPICGGIWWPASTEETEAEKLWNSEQAYKNMLAKKGGSNRNAGRKREKKRLEKNYWLET